MPVVSFCPSGEELKQFARGTLEAASADRIIRHLQQCRACLATLEGAPVEDTLIEALKTWGGTVGGDKAAVEGLIQRLKNLAIGAAPDPELTEAETPAAKSDRLDFLSPPQEDGEIGRLGGYRVLQVLGAGGMGVVLAAEDVRLKRKAALKVMKPELAANEGAKMRFLREAETCAAVRSDHIVTIYQVGEEGDAPFLAMEYLEGVSLDDWLKKGRKPSPAQTARIGRQIALGLSAAHERGLIHRDIKPGNIWLESNHQGRVKLLDFGLARGMSEEIHLTASGAIVGTPAYMAPEQARGEYVDHRVDLFSLGVVLYRLTTGQLPFRGDNTMSILTALALDTPKPPREINADIPPRMAELIERLLSKDREQRPATARAVADELATIEREASQPATDERTLELANRQRKLPGDAKLPSETATRQLTLPVRRWLVAASLLLLLGGVAAAIVIIVRDKDGNKIAEINVPEDGKIEIVDKGEANRQRQLPGDPIVAPPLAPLLPGEPLSPVALVQHPAKLPGVRSWSIESRSFNARVDAAVYRPDGKRLAVGSMDGSIRIWEPQTGRLMQVLLAVGMVGSGGLAWSPDGRILAAGYGEGNLPIRLWEAETGRLLRTFDGVAQYHGFRLAWTPDGRRLLAARRGECVTLDATSGKHLHMFPLSDADPGAFSPDGKLLAGGSFAHPGQILIWDVESGKEIRQLSGAKPGSGTFLSWSLDGKKLADAAANGVFLWEVATGKQILHRKDLIGSGVIWSLDGRSWVEGPQGQNLTELGSEQGGRVLNGTGPFSPDGKTVVDLRNYWSGIVSLHDAATGKQLRSLSEGFLNGATFSWSAVGPTVGVTAFWKTSVFSVDTGQVIAVLKEVNIPPVCSPNGKRWATVGRDSRTVFIWEDGGKTRLTLPGHQQDVNELAWSPDGRHLASLSAAENRMLLWDADKGEKLRELGPLPVGGWRMMWSADGRLVAFSDPESRWHFWDVEQNKVVNDPKQWGASGIAFSPNGRTVLTFTAAECQLRELAAGKVLSGQGGRWRGPQALSPDGRLLAIPTYSSVEVWRGDLSRRVRTLQAGGIIDGAFISADGKLVAGLYGGRLRLWETDTGRPRGNLLLGEANHGLTISADGHYNGNEQVERGIVVVVKKDDGSQEVLEPADFEQKYGWKNEPDKVHLLQPLPPPLYPLPGMPMGPNALVREPAELPDTNSWTIETVNPRGQVKAVAYRPDGKSLATGGEDGTIRLWDTSSGKLLRMLVGEAVQSLAWSKDGKRLFVAETNGKVCQWEADTGRSLGYVAETIQPAQTTARSPDGKQTATADNQGVFLSDASGKRTHTLEESPGHGSLSCANWSPDG